MWIRTTRVTLLVALLLATAVLAYLAAHPQLYAGYISRVVTRNLLRDTGVAFSYENMDGSPWSDFRLFDVDLTYEGDGGAFGYLTADTLAIQYDLRALLRGQVRVSKTTVSNARLIARARRSDAVLPPRTRRSSGGRPSVQIRDAAIQDLSIVFNQADGSQETIRGVQWSGDVWTDVDGIGADIGSLIGSWDNRGLVVRSLDGRARFTEGALHLEGVHAVTDSSDVMASGSIDADGLHLDAKVEPFSLGELLGVLGVSEAPVASFTGAARLDGLNPLRIEATVSGEIESYEFEDMEVVSVIDDEGLRFERARGRFLQTLGSVTGDLDFASGVLRLQGSGADMDLSQPWTREDLEWPSSDLQGRVELVLGLVEPLFLDLALRDVQGELVGLPVDSLRLDLHFDEPTGTRFDAFRLRSLQTWFEGAGTVDSSGILDVSVTAKAADASLWSERYALPVRGRDLDAVGWVHGPALEPALRVGGSVGSVEGLGLVGQGVRGLIEIDRFDSHEKLRGEIVAEALRVGGRFVGSLQTKLDRDWPRTSFPSFELSFGDTSLVASGRLIEGEERQRLEIDALEFVLGPDVWALSAPTAVNLGSGWARAEEMRVASPSGSWSLRGGADEFGQLDLEIELQDGELGLLSRLGLGPSDLAGRVSGTVRLGGRTDIPTTDVALRIEQPVGFGRSVDDLQLALSSSGSSMRVDSLLAQSDQGRIDLRGRLQLRQPESLRRLVDDPAAWRAEFEPTELDLSLRTAALNVRYWIDPTSEIEDLGRVSGRVLIAGTAIAPRVGGELTIDELPAGVLRIPRIQTAFSADPSGLRLEDGLILAPDPWLRFQAELPLRFSILSAPRWEQDAEVDLLLSSDGVQSLAPLRELYPDLDEIDGRLELSYRAQGTMAQPRLEGFVRVREGAAQLTGMLERAREAELDARFIDGTLVVERVRAREGLKGIIEGSGSIPFEGLLPADITMDLTADRFQLKSIRGLRALVKTDDFKIVLARPGPNLPRVPKYTGTLDVIQARYIGEFGEGGGGEATVLAGTTTPEWLAEFQARAPRTVHLVNSSADLLLDGDVDFVRDLSGIRLRGVVGIPQGRVPIFNNDFTIIRGELDFSREPGLSPAVDIEAETEVPDYRSQGAPGRTLERVTVHLTGTFDNLQTQFSSESNYDEGTIVRMLAGFSDETGGEGIADVGFKAGLNFFERSIAREIRGVDTVDIETEAASISEVGSTRLAVGKYLSPNLYLRYSQGLSISERDLFLEYQMTRHLLISSEVRRRLRESSAQTEFNVDLKYRVEY